MTTNNFETYRNLQIHLDQFPIGLPATKSGIELKVLKHVFTEEEAFVATKLDWSYKTLEEIYEIVKNKEISLQSLNVNLENMIKKGTIKYKVDHGKKLFKNIPLFVGIFEYQVNKFTKEFLNDFEEYLLTTFGAEVLGTKIFQYRTIPIEESITPEHHVANYDEIKQLINNIKQPIGVTNCVCRQAKDLFEEPCSKTDLRETCLYFGRTGQLFIDQGWARSISNEEAIELLNKAQKHGLVFQSGNTINPEFICCCCGCCCGMLEGVFSKLPNPLDFWISNYYAEVDPELCSGCLTCIDRCNVNAIKFRKSINSSKVNLRRCIGCGLCVTTCPEQAITLHKKEKEYIPPKNQEDMYETIINLKKGSS